MTNTINKDEIQKFSRRWLTSGGMLMENLNPYICLIQSELNTF
jgi:hypothetical protein